MGNYRPSPLANRPRTEFSGLIGDLPRIVFGNPVRTQTQPPAPASTPTPVEPVPSQVPSPTKPSAVAPEPWITPESSAKLRQLASVIGLAKAFGNHEEVKAVLDKLQSKVTNLSNGETTTTDEALLGIDRCIIYFSQETAAPTKHSQNKAGALLNFAASFAELLALKIGKESGINRERQMTKQFLTRLQALLLTLEQWEYHKSHFVL